MLKLCVEKFHKTAPSPSPRRISMGTMERSMAAFRTASIWPQQTVIRVSFMEEPTAIERTRYSKRDLHAIDPLQPLCDALSIKEAIVKTVQERIQPLVNLKFIFVDKEGDVRITFKPEEGSWSYIGNEIVKKGVKEEPTMNFGWFDVATVMHEFGHALSLIHEHQNPRGNQIQWDVKKVYEWGQVTQGWDETTTYNNIILRENVEATNGSKYDPESIMLYFFPAELTLNHKGTRQNLRLSLNDVTYLMSTYPPLDPLFITPSKQYQAYYPKKKFELRQWWFWNQFLFLFLVGAFFTF